MNSYGSQFFLKMSQRGEISYDSLTQYTIETFLDVDLKCGHKVKRQHK
jgi:hypothetical protein